MRESATLPNGLELSCPAEAGSSPLLYARPAGDSSASRSAARRVSFSELLGRSERCKRDRDRRTQRGLVSTGTHLLSPRPTRKVEAYGARQHGDEEPRIARLEHGIQNQRNDKGHIGPHERGNKPG